MFRFMASVTVPITLKEEIVKSVKMAIMTNLGDRLTETKSTSAKVSELKLKVTYRGKYFCGRGSCAKYLIL